MPYALITEYKRIKNRIEELGNRNNRRNFFLDREEGGSEVDRWVGWFSVKFTERMINKMEKRREEKQKFDRDSRRWRHRRVPGFRLKFTLVETKR